jgi:hypothetical protein
MYAIGSGAAWTPWTGLGGVQAVGRPALLVLPGVGLDVLVQAAGGALLRRRLSQVRVTPWETLERRPPGPVSAVAVDGALELVTISAAGAVLRRRWLPPLPLDPTA